MLSPREIVIREVELVELASGLRCPEGPVAMADGSVIVVEMIGERLTRIARDGTCSTVAEVPGGPNGAALGPDGAMYLCNNGRSMTAIEMHGMLFPGPFDPARYLGGSIQRVDLATGQLSDLYRECNGRPLRAPNDLVMDGEGGFWFTDNGITDVLGARTRDLTAIYYARCDGSMIREAVFPAESPNGIGLSPDGSTLIWAETLTGRVRHRPIVGVGEVAPEDLFGPSDVLFSTPGSELARLARSRRRRMGERGHARRRRDHRHSPRRRASRVHTDRRPHHDQHLLRRPRPPHRVPHGIIDRTSADRHVAPRRARARAPAARRRGHSLRGNLWLRLAWQTEDALRDDVALDLVRATLDGVRATAHERSPDVARHDTELVPARGLPHLVGVPQHPVGAEQLHAHLVHRLVELAATQLGQRSFRSRRARPLLGDSGVRACACTRWSARRGRRGDRGARESARRPAANATARSRARRPALRHLGRSRPHCAPPSACRWRSSSHHRPRRSGTGPG